MSKNENENNIESNENENQSMVLGTDHSHIIQNDHSHIIQNDHSHIIQNDHSHIIQKDSFTDSHSKKYHTSPVKNNSISSPIRSNEEEDDLFRFMDFKQPSPPRSKESNPTLFIESPKKTKESNPTLFIESPKKTIAPGERNPSLSLPQTEMSKDVESIIRPDPDPDRFLWEKQAHMFENQLVDLSTQLKSLQKEKQELTETLSKQTHDTDLLKKRLLEKENQIQLVVSENQNFNAKSLHLDQERQSLTAAILAKDKEISRLSDELEKASSKIFELKQELRVEIEKFSDSQANELSLKATLASNEHELAQSVKMTLWLTSELETKSNEFISYRKEKSDQIKTLQSSLEENGQEKNGLEVRCNLLQKRVDDLESKLAVKMDHLQEVENDRIISEQQFKNEMNAQKKLTELYLGKSQELSTHNLELESLVRELESKVLEMNEEKEASVREFEDQLARQKKIEQQQELELEQIRSQIKLINNDLQMDKQADQVAQLSQTAAAASRFQKTGKSFTQVYSDYTALQQDYIKEKSEVARLTECLNHIVSEFEQRAPIIQKTNEEYQKARDQIENMSIELSNAIREKAEAVAQYKKIKTSMEQVEISQALLEKDIEDRNRQLKAVLREHEILKGAHPSSLSEPNESDFSSLSGADAIISKRLVIFKNIEELQSQNQALLRSIRSLSAKMESQEKVNLAQADQARLEALDQSVKLIERLEEQLKRESLNSESFAKERDQWRRIAESRGARQGSPGRTTPAPSPEREKRASGPDYESFYRELQREFDVYRKESGTDTKVLKSQLERAQEEKTELSIQVAKFNNQIGYLNERHELLVQSTQSKDKEASQLRERLSSINETATRQDIKIEELANSLLQARQSMETVTAENQQYKIERQIWKSSEARVLKESQDLVKERNAANDRIRELQDTLDESDRKSGMKIKRMEDQVEEVNRDLQLSRKQLADVIDDHRTLTAKRDAELREFQIKMERMTIDFERTKGELALAINKEQNATLRIQELTVKISALEQKSLIYDGRSRRTDGTGLEGNEGELSDLQSEIRQVKIELAAAKAELAVAKDQADAFKAISQASEDRLAEMNGTYDIYKLEMEQKIAELTNIVGSLEADKADMQQKLTKLGESLRETQESMDSQVEEFNSAKSLYERQIVTLKENEEAANKAIASMKLDLSRQVIEAQSCQAKYEQEVVNHSLSLQQVASMKSSNEGVVKARDDALLSLQVANEKLSAVQNSFDSIKSKLEKDISDLEMRVEDLKTQNTLLHSQFEQLSISRASFADADTKAEAGSEAQVSSKSVSDLSEVIKFLRREKEIVETKLQISMQENDRSRLHLDQFQKSLDESRAILDEERKKSQEMMGSDKKHVELLEKIEQTNILRESNITLRGQLELSQKKLDDLDKKLKETEVQLEPLKGQVSQLESEVEARKKESKALLEDNSRWKDRAQQILEKYNRIDPVEHENLKTKVATLTAEIERLQSQLSNFQSDVGTRVVEKEAEIKSLQSEIAALKQQHIQALEQKEIELAGLRDPETNDQIVALAQDLQASKAKNRKVAKEANEKLKAKTARIVELQAEISSLKNQKSETDSTLLLKIQETENRLNAERQAEIKKITDSLEQKYTIQLKTMQASMQAIQTQVVASVAAKASSATTEAAVIPAIQTPTPKRTRDTDKESNVVSANQISSSPQAKRIRVQKDQQLTEEVVAEQPATVVEEQHEHIPTDNHEGDKDEVMDDQEEMGDAENEEGTEEELEEEEEEEHFEEEEEELEEGQEESAEEIDEDVTEEPSAVEIAMSAPIKQVSADEDEELINILTPEAVFEPVDPDLAFAGEAAPEEPVAEDAEKAKIDQSTPQKNVVILTEAAPIQLPPEVVIRPSFKISIKPPPAAAPIMSNAQNISAASPPTVTGQTKVAIQRPKSVPTATETSRVETAAPSEDQELSSAVAQLHDKLVKEKKIKALLDAEKAQALAAPGLNRQKPIVGRINRNLTVAGTATAGAPVVRGRGGAMIRGRGKGKGRGQQPAKQG